MRPRVVIGRDVDVIRDGPDEIELIGRVRLRPGFVVDITPGAKRPRPSAGPAMVQSWRIRVLGSNGPIYRGVCRWYPSATPHNGDSTLPSREVGAKP